MESKLRIGVLGLQGDFREHLERFNELGCETTTVRRSQELQTLDALVIPGGESTAVGILEQSEQSFQTGSLGIFEAIRHLAAAGLPIWGTCMGSILLAKQIEGSTQGRLALMDITVRRNAFGPQRFSAEIPIQISAFTGHPFPGFFIRAPLITSVGPNVQILGRITEGIVMAREASLLATVFHPEITGDTRVHDYFLQMVRESAYKKQAN